MRTGEGKTFIPTLAAVLNGLSGRGAHVVTVNDYLARRDAQWMGPAYRFLGLSVGVITHDTSYLFEPGFPTTDERLMNLRPVTRREAYAADITYGTNNEFGFDYLRDNMVDQLEAPGAARALLRDRGRGRQHPHRRGADPAHHLGPGRGVGGPVLLLRPPRAAPQGPARGRGGGRRLLRRPQGQGRQPHRGGRRQDRAAPGHREPVRRGSAARPPLRLGAQGARAVQARPGLHRRGRRDRHRGRVHRPQDAGPALERGPAPGDRGQGGPARPARVPDARHDHVPELLPPLRQAGRHDRHGDDRGRGVPQDLQPRGRGDPHPPPDDPRRLPGPRVQERGLASSTR